MPSGVREISIEAIHANPNQPRTQFDPEALAELAESIGFNGILQPILVRPRKEGGFEIVAGERRWRAAGMARLQTIPAVVREFSDAESLAMALIENLIRADIGAIETARAFRRLMDDFQWTQEEMAARVGKSRSSVANSLRLLQLPVPILESLERGAISEGHARALLISAVHLNGANYRDRQMEVWLETLRQSLPVRETEKLMIGTPPAVVPPTEPKLEEKKPAPKRKYHMQSRLMGRSPDIEALEASLQGILGIRVEVDGDEVKGVIRLEYYSAEDLEMLSRRLGIASDT